MKIIIISTCICFLFACTKDKTPTIGLPNGFYDLKVNYDPLPINLVGYYDSTKNDTSYYQVVEKVNDGDGRLISFDDSYLNIYDKEVSGFLHVFSSHYEVEGDWNYDANLKKYTIKGNFTENTIETVGVNSLINGYYTGNFEISKVVE